MGVELRDECSRNTHFGKCPHFCISSGPFSWDNVSVSYFFGIWKAD